MDLHFYIGHPMRKNSPCVVVCSITSQPTSNPTVEPQSNPMLKYVGNNWIPEDMFPLSACQGDCDIDDDCEGSLVCQQRNGNEEVLGCSGSADWATDYCRYPDSIRDVATPSPTVVLTSQTATLSPTVSPSISVQPSDVPSEMPSVRSLI